LYLCTSSDKYPETQKKRDIYGIPHIYPEVLF